MKKIFAYLAMLTPVTMLAQSAKYGFAKEIYNNPSILEEPMFWIVILIVGLCVFAYALSKDNNN